MEALPPPLVQFWPVFGPSGPASRPAQHWLNQFWAVLFTCPMEDRRIVQKTVLKTVNITVVTQKLHTLSLSLLILGSFPLISSVRPILTTNNQGVIFVYDLLNEVQCSVCSDRHKSVKNTHSSKYLIGWAKLTFRGLWCLLVSAIMWCYSEKVHKSI